MRGMKTRQVKKLISFLLTLLTGLYACSPSNQPTPTLAPFPLTASQTPEATYTATPNPTFTALVCLTQPGRVEEGVLNSTDPPQEFLIYLPPCYDEKIDQRYPVLY